MKIPLPYIIIGVLILVIIIMRSCQPGPEIIEKPVIVTKIDTVWVEKPIEKLVYVPVEKTLIKYLPGEIKYIDVDTSAILEDYFSKRIFEDKIQLDSFGYVLVRDTVSQNKIISRTTEGKYKFPTITTTTTITNPPIYKAKFFIGFDIEGNKTQPISYFGPNVTLVTKRDKLYSIGAGYGPNEEINYKFGMGFKIGKRR